jgi:hypothetical protein
MKESKTVGAYVGHKLQQECEQFWLGNVKTVRSPGRKRDYVIKTGLKRN